MKESLKKNMDELGIILGLIVIATLFIVLIDTQQELNPVDPGAGAFPIMAATFTIILCLIQIVILFRKKTEDQQGEEDIQTSKSRGSKTLSIILTMALTIGYIYFFDIINYMVLTGIFTFAVMLVLGVRKWTVLLSVSIIYAVVSYYVYGEFLNIPI